jgi:cobyrinic acid a,c-diamide synthase
MKAVLFAGTKSGTGKTFITIAVMNALSRIGKKIACFKAGPDFIDPKFHAAAAGLKSYNLDSWMNNENTIRMLAAKHIEGKDFGIIEGMMGLYDGYDFSMTASSAHIAIILDCPVILIVDAKGTSLSLCAEIAGFKNFDRDVKFGGVIINNVPNEDFYLSIKKIIESKIGLECLGYFPKIKDVELKSRHLGLIPAEEIKDINHRIEKLSDQAFKSIQLDRIEKIACENKDKKSNKTTVIEKFNGHGLKVAVAKDEAFNFYYEDNLELMAESDMKIIEFSPLNDRRVPGGIDGIYLGGGYPEEYIKELSKNTFMLDEIKEKLENGMPLFGECGGLMYLTNGIIDKNGCFHKTAGFFNCKARMTSSLQRFGYVEIEYDGLKIRAHEFHYSVLETKDNPDFKLKYKVIKPNKGKIWQCGLAKKNVIAGYPHIHFYSNLDFFTKIIELFRRKAG